MTNECAECPGCMNHFCTWCEDEKPCEGCGEQLCENCSFDFQECDGCKKKHCTICVDEWIKCEEEGCSVLQCDDCMEEHAVEHEEEKEEASDAPNA